MTIYDIEIALNFCLNNTYFIFQGKFYQQIFGVPMGSPISVTIANLVMEHIEIKAINSFFSPQKYMVEIGRWFICHNKIRYRKKIFRSYK